MNQGFCYLWPLDSLGKVLEPRNLFPFVLPNVSRPSLSRKKKKKTLKEHFKSNLLIFLFRQLANVAKAELLGLGEFKYGSLTDHQYDLGQAPLPQESSWAGTDNYLLSIHPPLLL